MGAICFRALCLVIARTTVGPSPTFCSVVRNARIITERNVGVSPPDVGAFCFRALCLGRARTTVGPSPTFRSVVCNARMDTERDVGVSPPDVSAICFRALCQNDRAYDGRTVGYISLCIHNA